MAKEVKLALKPGDVAPAFSATTTDGSAVSLRELLGRDVVLYFYPRDNTPGCNKEACGFRDAHDGFRRRGAVVLGVSGDSQESHRKFTAKFGLPFPLLVDADHAIATAYGAWGEKSFMGRRFMGIHRVTFHIGPDGRVAHVWPKVEPEAHAAEVLAALG